MTTSRHKNRSRSRRPLLLLLAVVGAVSLAIVGTAGPALLPGEGSGGDDFTAQAAADAGGALSAPVSPDGDCDTDAAERGATLPDECTEGRNGGDHTAAAAGEDATTDEYILSVAVVEDGATDGDTPAASGTGKLPGGPGAIEDPTGGISINFGGIEVRGRDGEPAGGADAGSDPAGPNGAFGPGGGDPSGSFVAGDGDSAGPDASDGIFGFQPDDGDGSGADDASSGSGDSGGDSGGVFGGGTGSGGGGSDDGSDIGSGDNSGSGTSDGTDDGSGDDSGSGTGDGTGDDSRSDSGDDSGSDSGDSSGSGSDEDCDDGSDDDCGDGTGDNSGSGSGGDSNDPPPPPPPSGGGPVDLVASPGSAVVSFSNMAPGDSVIAVLVLTNNDSTELRYAMTTSATNADGKNLAGQLLVTIRLKTSNPCSAEDGAILYGSGPLSGAAFGDPAQGAQAGDRVLAPGASEQLCIKVELPLSSGNETQNAATVASFVFDAEETFNNP